MRDQNGTRNAEIGATIRQVRQSKKMSLAENRKGVNCP